MDKDIETLDKLRMRFLLWHLIGTATFVLLILVRFFLWQEGLNSQPIGIAVLVGLILCVAIMGLSTIGLMILGRTIKDSAPLQEALNNELVQALETQSWKAAYLGAIGVTLFFAVACFFYPDCDPVLIALTSIIAGAGAYRANFYFRYRSS